MKAVIYHGPRDIRLEERRVPEPGPGEVVVKTGAALTCGTDFKAFRQGHRVLLGDYPSPFGHELAGFVAAAGKGVTSVREGDRVVVANSAPMDDCFWCRSGQNHLCRSLKLHNGACAIHAAEVHGVREGELCLVVGAGPMCLFLIHALRARGARVAVLGRSKEALEAAKEAGAEATFSSLDGHDDDVIHAWAEGRGPDHVFEAVGKAETYERAVALVRDGGRVCLFGGCAAGTMIPFDVHRLHYKQITLHGVFHHNPRHFHEAVRLLAAGKVRTELLIKGELRLEELPRFFAANAERSLPKAVVRP